MLALISVGPRELSFIYLELNPLVLKVNSIIIVAMTCNTM